MNKTIEEAPIDFRFDIDALFAHLTGELGHNIEDELDWSFALRSNDLALLEKISIELEDDFLTHVQESVEEEDSEGNAVQGDPILVLVDRGAMTAEEVKEIVNQLSAIANERGLTYEGVDCCDPIDYEEIFGWIAPEDVLPRLQSMNDNGLTPDVPLPWTFLLQTPSVEATKAIKDALSEADMSDIDEFDEPDEDGNFGLCVFVPGRNNEAALAETLSGVTEIAESHGGAIDGVQFYTREEVEEVFGEEEELEEAEQGEA